MGHSLDREEYIEQAYLFSSLGERLATNEPIQVLLKHVKQELLVTTKLPMAIDYLLAELNHSGSMAEAMTGMSHYFAAFQTYLVAESENEVGRIDIQSVVSILEHEARSRANDISAVGLFFFQLEVLCRHRLSYDQGLAAMAEDPMYDESWKQWLLTARTQLGFVDMADLIYVHSEHYVEKTNDSQQLPEHVLFGQKEGRIALANRRKDPLYLFAALQRQLNYPKVPRPFKADPTVDVIPRLAKTVEQLKVRVKLMEDEQRNTGIDLSQFFGDGEK